MNKNKKKKIIILIFTVIATIGIIFIIKNVDYNKKMKNNKEQSKNNDYNIIEKSKTNETKNDEIPTVPFDREKYDKNTKHLAENEANGIEEKTIIIIRDEKNI